MTERKADGTEAASITDDDSGFGRAEEQWFSVSQILKERGAERDIWGEAWRLTQPRCGGGGQTGDCRGSALCKAQGGRWGQS